MPILTLEVFLGSNEMLESNVNQSWLGASAVLHSYVCELDETL